MPFPLLSLHSCLLSCALTSAGMGSLCVCVCVWVVSGVCKQIAKKKREIPVSSCHFAHLGVSEASKKVNGDRGRLLNFPISKTVGD